MHITFGTRRIPLPGNRWLRILLGIVLVLGGMVSFLPFLGLWMLPFGIILLSLELPFLKPVVDYVLRKLKHWFGWDISIEDDDKAGKH